MWTYEQKTGRLISNSGELVGVGYSGSPLAKNNPELQQIRDQGPIPRGMYMISAPVDTVTHGPYVLPLAPDAANTMFGRSGFLIHGDSVVSPGSASEGCIIMARMVREDVWNSGDHDLKVVEG